jgi:hypothetical protein
MIAGAPPVGHRGRCGTSVRLTTGGAACPCPRPPMAAAPTGCERFKRRRRKTKGGVRSPSRVESQPSRRRGQRIRPREGPLGPSSLKHAPVAQGIERCPAEAEAARSNRAGRMACSSHFRELELPRSAPFVPRTLPPLPPGETTSRAQWEREAKSGRFGRWATSRSASAGRAPAGGSRSDRNRTAYHSDRCNLLCDRSLYRWFSSGSRSDAACPQGCSGLLPMRRGPCG